MGDAEGELRAKYLDWCSARIAERFLELSPEEIYELARPAESVPAQPAEVSAAPAVDASYRVLVQRVTESLLGRMTLPGFEAWSAAYAEAPEQYDAEMLGFWRDVSGGGG